jgi:hypothetical protein
LLTFQGVDCTYCQKWRPTRVHKKSRTQFWLSESSGIMYHLWAFAFTSVLSWQHDNLKFYIFLNNMPKIVERLLLLTI